jgi:hypothetical protein
MVPGVIKGSKTVSSFKWHRDGDQPLAGPHPDPDTSYETIHGSLDVNLQVYPSK